MRGQEARVRVGTIRRPGITPKLEFGCWQGADRLPLSLQDLRQDKSFVANRSHGG